MSDYTHEKWISELTVRTRLIKGDDAALMAIRRETAEHHGVDDITEDAPVFLWTGLYVKGLDEKSYEVPDHTRRRYLVQRTFPMDPVAEMPAETGESRRKELMGKSAPVEGSDVALAEVINRTRLFHEMPTAMFPVDGELRWFINGIFVIGQGDDPAVFQAPMARLADMVVPRAHPQLPYLRDPKPTL